MEERFLSLLRCPHCRGSLSLAAEALCCPECLRTYPLQENIPLFLNEAGKDNPWEKYFNEQAKEKGDSIAANSYLHEAHFRLLRQAFYELIGQVEGAVILDVGCGTGHFASSLAGQNFLVGLDVSLGMLKAAATKGFHPVLSQGGRWPVADDAFDLVLANSVLQCVAEAEMFLAEMSRACRPGGRLIISAFNCQNIGWQLIRHLVKRQHPRLFFHPISKVVGLLKEYGSELIKINLLFYPLPWRKQFKRLGRFSRGVIPVASSFVLEAKKSSSS